MLFFLCSSAYGADYYYSDWEQAMFHAIMDGKVAGFYTDTSPNVCWVQIYGTTGHYNYPNPNALRSPSAVCTMEYASRGIFILPFVGMSEEEVIEVLFGFCGIVGALCFVIPILRAI